MTAHQGRVLDELPLPLGSSAALLDAIGIAVALEDALGVSLPDELIDLAHLGCRDAIEAVLHEIAPHL